LKGRKGGLTLKTRKVLGKQRRLAKGERKTRGERGFNERGEGSKEWQTHRGGGHFRGEGGLEPGNKNVFKIPSMGCEKKKTQKKFNGGRGGDYWVGDGDISYWRLSVGRG